MAQAKSTGERQFQALRTQVVTCLRKKIPDRTKRSGSLRGTQGSLSGVDGDASVRALRGTDAAGLHWDKDVIVEGIGGDAMRVAVGGHVLQPGVGLGVDHAHHRSSGHVPCRQVPPLIPGVEPGLIHAADGGDGSQNLARAAVHHDLAGRESHTVMVLAGYQEVVARPLNSAAGHAALNREGVDHDRPVRVADARIDFIDGPSGQVGRDPRPNGSGIGIRSGERRPGRNG